MARTGGNDLVKLVDGSSKEITQHKLEESVGDLDPGGSFIDCAGSCGGYNFHTGCAGRCAASQTRLNRATAFPHPEHDTSDAGSTKARFRFH